MIDPPTAGVEITLATEGKEREGLKLVEDGVRPTVLAVIAAATFPDEVRAFTVGMATPPSAKTAPAISTDFVEVLPI